MEKRELIAAIAGFRLAAEYARLVSPKDAEAQVSNYISDAQITREQVTEFEHQFKGWLTEVNQALLRRSSL